MSTKIQSTMVSVRFYIASDTYYYTTSNRPLTDLNTNLVTLATYLNQIETGFQAAVCVDNGIANALQPSTSFYPASPALPLGTTITFPCNNSNTGATTLQLNQMPVLPLVSAAGALQGGELVQGKWIVAAYSGSEWLLLAQEEGSLPLAPGKATQPAVLGQVQDGVMALSLTNVSAGSLLGNTLLAETVTLPAAVSPPELINYGQLQSGIAQANVVIPWNNVTVDTPLQVGQVAYYSITSPVSNIPLHISCAYGQIYEVDLLLQNPLSGWIAGTGLDTFLNPNNTTYSGAFNWSEIMSAETNQGQIYEASSTTTEFGVTVNYSGTANSFYIDDINGGAQPSYQRHIKLHTGSTATPACLVNISGGGSNPSGTAGTAYQGAGTNLAMSTWNDVSTNYTSLGTFLLTSSTACGWTIFVKRVF